MLEAESGYTMESPEVAEFRHYVMEASWEQVEAALIRLGVTDEDNLMVCSIPRPGLVANLIVFLPTGV